MNKKHAGICPYCSETVQPFIITENYARRDVCKCPKCEKEILVCRIPGCSDYAKGGPIYDEEMCPSCTAGIVNGGGEVVKYGLMAAAAVIATAVSGKITKD